MNGHQAVIETESKRKAMLVNAPSPHATETRWQKTQW